MTKRLAVSSRTLRRQLHEEGTPTRPSSHAPREDLARYYLRQGNLRAGEIAYLLGYDDTNSFYRAFRDWTAQHRKPSAQPPQADQTKRSRAAGVCRLRAIPEMPL